MLNESRIRNIVKRVLRENMENEFKDKHLKWETDPTTVADDSNTDNSWYTGAAEWVNPGYTDVNGKSGRMPKLFHPSNEGFYNKLKQGGTNLDMGGGKFDVVSNHLAEHGVDSFVFDPFNRDESHNMAALQRIQDEGGVDTITCCNCLNVIRSADEILNVIKQCARALKPDGVAFFLMYKPKVASKNANVAQTNMETQQYAIPIKRYFQDVAVYQDYILAKHPKTFDSKTRWLMNGNEEDPSKQNVREW